MIPNGVKIMFNLSVQIPVPSTKTDDSYDINDDVEIYFDTSNYEEGIIKRPLPVEKKKNRLMEVVTKIWRNGW